MRWLYGSIDFRQILYVGMLWGTLSVLGSTNESKSEHSIDIEPGIDADWGGRMFDNR